MIHINGVPAMARALGQGIGEGTLCDSLIADGLVITNTSISIPTELLNSVLWMTTEQWERHRDDLGWDMSSDEINEMNALKRLMDRLKKLGATDDLADKYNQ